MRKSQKSGDFYSNFYTCKITKSVFMLIEFWRLFKIILFCDLKCLNPSIKKMLDFFFSFDKIFQVEVSSENT